MAMMDDNLEQFEKTLAELKPKKVSRAFETSLRKNSLGGDETTPCLNMRKWWAVAAAVAISAVTATMLLHQTADQPSMAANSGNTKRSLVLMGVKDFQMKCGEKGTIVSKTSGAVYRKWQCDSIRVIKWKTPDGHTIKTFKPRRETVLTQLEAI